MNLNNESSDEDDAMAEPVIQRIYYQFKFFIIAVEEPKKKSKKQLKKERRPSIAVLKQLVRRPDIVEVFLKLKLFTFQVHDVNASDPGFLVTLKSVRNTVPVPSHWLSKKRFLAGKRGYMKAPYVLPDYIQATGITELRNSNLAKDASKSMAQIMKERMRPKTGKISIDYAVLQVYLLI